MSGTISTERVFSLACFEGLRLYRKYSEKHPNLDVADLLDLIHKVEADAHSLDMDASVYLSSIVDDDCSLDGEAFYQTCIRSVLLKHQPIWAKLMRQGRERFVRKLAVNDQDIFAAAGLRHKPAPLEVVTWWDSISGHARLLADREKMEQGRAAEILTLEYERRRLKDMGIDKELEWPGFDDNFAGYDVLSYDRGPSGIQNKLIEVKSTTVSPVRFIVTRNEWDKAEKAGNAYNFHVWNLQQSPPQLIQRSVDDVALHIPEDSGKGRWLSAQIPVTGS